MRPESLKGDIAAMTALVKTDLYLFLLIFYHITQITEVFILIILDFF